jgi:hypothetical protein
MKTHYRSHWEKVIKRNGWYKVPLEDIIYYDSESPLWLITSGTYTIFLIGYGEKYIAYGREWMKITPRQKNGNTKNNIKQGMVRIALFL